MANTVSDVEDLPTDQDWNEEEEEEDVEEEKEPSIYFSEDFISGPTLSEESTVPGNILEFDYSYGYDCKRYFNLVVADPNTIIFASGNYLNFFNVTTKEIIFRRSAFGGGIGHITKNPNLEYPHIAVGENGDRPPIIIYDWPSFDIVCLLREGTSRCFTHLNYSPDGMLLASQGGEPDYLITIFNWTKRRILLRTKSYVNEVFRVMFSPDVPGQLTSCGLAHIKFWKMAETFTGLKLKGELGRFGKTEYSDIVGIYPMPDEKILSGSSWGNILVWDEGLIKLEVCRNGRQRCHDGPITQFFYDYEELWTVGMDGRVKVWFYEFIEQADPPDTDRFVELEPLYNFQVPGVMFMCIGKVTDDPKDTFFYAQDGNGGLWQIDLNTEEAPQPPVQLYKCHAGAIADIAACPWGPYLASLGTDGRLQIYQYITQELLLIQQFPAKGASMVWLPLKVEAAGDQLIMGFDDGIVRLVVLKFEEDPLKVQAITIQVTKPHTKPITKLVLNDESNVLVTGSVDATIFIYRVQSLKHNFSSLIPIGYIPVPGIVTWLNWHPKRRLVIMVGCIHGHFLQVKVPSLPQTYTGVSYKLTLKVQQQQFTTYKAQIRRDIKLQEIQVRKDAKLLKKMEELEKVKADNPGLDIDEEVFLADSESEEILEPLHIPDIPNRILWMQVTAEDTIWLSMAGYDAGYIYEYRMDKPTDIPYRFQIIYNGDNIEISSFLYNYSRKYLILAMEDGSLRVVKVNPTDWRDLSNYWQLSMHDNYNGFIPRMCFSYNEKYFFSCGNDGNVFSYKFNPEQESKLNISVAPRPEFTNRLTPVLDVNGYAKLSLEESNQKAEYDRQQKVANDHKAILRERLGVLRVRFEEVLKRNLKLLPTQIIPRPQLELDPRISAHLQGRLYDDLALVKRKLAYQVEKSKIGMEKLRGHFTDAADLFPITVRAINKNVILFTTRQRKLSDKFDQMMKMVEQKILEAEIKARPPERAAIVQEAPHAEKRKEKQIEYFLTSLTKSQVLNQLGPKLVRLLTKYRERKTKLEKRQERWDEFIACKPAEGVNDPEDEELLRVAIETIGNFKLKSASDYKVPAHLRESTVKKYKQLLETRERQFTARHDFNKVVYEFRAKKCAVINFLNKMNFELKTFHEELPAALCKSGPAVPEIKPEDFPENNVKLITKTDMKEQKPKAKTEARKTVYSSSDLLEKLVLTANPKERLISSSKADKSSQIEDGSAEICEDSEDPWETQVRNYRVTRKQFEQDIIIRAMQQAIEDFDNELEETSKGKVKIIVNALLVDLHVLVLYQELIILKDFEGMEEQLQQKVNDIIESSFDIRDVIADLNNRIDLVKRDVDHLLEDERNIQQQFFSAVNDYKFYDFLRKIFKKRFKPPKVHDPDDESSSSESSSSSEESEEDAGSIDSRDFGIVKLDENVCPKGCDQTLYDLTFQLRTERHGIELETKNQRTLIEVLKKEIELNMKKAKVIEESLKRSQQDLEAYQREKQKKLNEVRCIVILYLNQLQHLVSEDKLENIGQTLLFSQTELSKLYKRVGQLYNETLQQKSKHKINIVHMARMKTDTKFMMKQVHELKREIADHMRMKFGREINIDEIEEVKLKGKVAENIRKMFGQGLDIDELDEAQLKRMVFNLRMSAVNLKPSFEAELQHIKGIYSKKQSELTQMVRDNTARLELLTAMNREKAELAAIVAYQNKKRDHIENIFDVAESYKKDIKKLSDIVKKQHLQLEKVREEIKRLRNKGLIPPQPASKPQKKIPAIEESKEQRAPQEDEQYEVEPEQEIRVEDLEGLEEISKWPEAELTLEKFDADKQAVGPLVIQRAIPKESEEIAKSLLFEMVESLECYCTMSRTTIESMIEQMLKDVAARTSVSEITQILEAYLPYEATNEQCGIIETTAEHLYVLQEALDEQGAAESATNILYGIIDDALLSAGAPHDVLAQLLTQLVEKLPVDFLVKPESIHTLTDKIIEYLPSDEATKELLIERTLSASSSRTDEIRLVLAKILEEVYGAGIDYLFYIKH